MSYAQVPILALIAVLASIPFAVADDNLVVAARETVVEVRPGAANRRLVNLPALTFGLRAAIKCEGEAQSLTLSIADTAKTLGQDDLENQRSAESSITVPARQVALAASKAFCVRDDQSTADELLVPGLATLHASLRCGDEKSSSVHYASAPLQVRLHCVRELPGTQESSAPR